MLSLNYTFNYVFCNLSLRLSVVGCKTTTTINDGHLVRINAEACALVLKTVKNNEVEILALHLVLSILQFVVCLKRKANKYLLLFLLGAKSSGNILRWLKLDGQVVALSLYLLVGSRLWREVSNCGT